MEKNNKCFLKIFVQSCISEYNVPKKSLKCKDGILGIQGERNLLNQTFCIHMQSIILKYLLKIP